MKIAKLVTVALAILVLSACNIKLRVGEGGTVTYAGGKKTCAEGQTCTIPVTNFQFSDVFTPKPKPGFEFAGWARRDRGLCGGTSKPCAIDMDKMPRDNKTRSYLNSDDENFFLVARFRPKQNSGGGGGGSGGAGSALACYNEELFNQGTQSHYVYRVTDPSVPTFDTDYNVMVVGRRSFNGQQALLTVTELEQVVDGLVVDAELSSYLLVNSNTKVIKDIGSEMNAQVQGASVTMTITRDPFSSFRFNMNRSDSFTEDYRVEVTMESPAFPPGFSQNQSFSNTERKTYLGRERITVGSGTYDTCKFEVRTTTSGLPGGNTDTNTIWYIVGLGVVAKQITTSGSGLELLKGSTLNGRSI